MFLLVPMMPYRKKSLPILLFVAVALGAAPVHAQDPAAGLQWEQTRIEIETDGGTQPAKVTYRFRNTGDRPVNILSTTASCGCTVPETNKTTYAPGESGELPVMHKPKPGAGVHVYSIRVQTDEGGGSAHALTLQVTNKPRIAVMPRVLNWAAGEARAPKQINVRIRRDQPLRLTGLQAEPDVVEMQIADGAQPGTKTVTVTPKAGTAFVPGRVRVRLITEPPLPPSMDNQFFVVLR